MKFVFTKQFIKDAKLFQHQKARKQLINEVIKDFQQHLLDSIYYRKKLQGYDHIHELQAGGDIRIIIEIFWHDDVCEFLRIGSHSSLDLTGTKKLRL